jgi:predicted ABC-type sugar transport system permease subunit
MIVTISDSGVMMRISEFSQMMIKGLVIVLAVVLDQRQQNVAKNTHLA